MSRATYNFDVKMIKEAEHWAAKSKDPSTQVGVVLVPAYGDVPIPGYNGFPRGVDDDEDNEKGRWDRPIKYSYVEHAERNAIYNAARMGVKTMGATMYFNFDPRPCTNCARAIIQAGVRRLVGYSHRPFPGKGTQWKDDLVVAETMLREAGVQISYLAPNAKEREHREAFVEKEEGCCGCHSCDSGLRLPNIADWHEAPRLPREK